MTAAKTPEAARELLLHDEFAQRMLAAPTPARLAYVGLDGAPRAIPIGFHFDPEAAVLVLATAEQAPKVAALRANPAVALTIDTSAPPWMALLLRGTASVTIVDGVVPEYLEANRRVSAPETWEAFEQGVTALYDRMARIEITPTWASMLDFVTRAPETVMKLAADKGLS